MPELLKVLILAAVQGCAEFLPISSSGHLAILSAFMDVKCDVLTLTIVLHAGTLLAILIYYFNFLKNIFRNRDKRLIFLIIISTIPTAIIGFSLRAFGIDTILFNNLLFPGIGLILTGIIILNGLTGAKGNSTQVADMTIKNALTIGLAQGFAIFPGISRSGTTISVAIKLGIKSEDAATFSFMLAIPVIAGASILEIAAGLSHNSSQFNLDALAHLALGFMVSAVVGYFSLKLLISTLKKDKLKGYAYYCMTMGVFVISWVLYKQF